MIVYVAGSTDPKETPRVKFAMDCLLHFGHTISFDWLGLLKEHGKANGLDRVDASMVSQMEVNAIIQAQVFFAVMPQETKSEGLFYEMAIADSNDIPTVVITNGNKPFSIFWYAKNREFVMDSYFTDWLRDNFGFSDG